MVREGVLSSGKLKTEYGVSQGTILGSMLFNIYVNVLFHLENPNGIIGYANDILTSVSDGIIISIFQQLRVSPLATWIAELLCSHSYNLLS